MVVKLTPRELQVGMVAIDAVVTPSGQILAPSGSILTRQIINKAKLYSVPFIFVNIENASAPEPAVAPTSAVAPTPVVAPPPIVEGNRKPATYAEETQSNSSRMIVSQEFKGFQLDYFLFIEHLKDVFSKLSTQNYTINTTELIEKLSPLYLSRNTITELFDMIGQMHSINDSVYAHCVNVALISRMIGRWLHFDQHDLDVLTCCGLLHDIGKLAIPDEVLNKPGKLTDAEFAMIKSHPRLGFNMLMNQNIDSRIKQSVLMHHERYDGTGYPNHLTSEFLPDFAMIVAIADVYDAMTATRSYREPLCAFQVIENFERDGYQKYHTKYIYTFLHQIASTYQSNRVMLNDGRIAKIVMLNQNRLAKPIVQFNTRECLDLSTTKDIYISKIL